MPMLDFAQQLNSAIESQLPFAYCNIIATRGSTPQKAGASMLVFPDGRQIGTIGGGCVEAEIKLRSLHSMREKARPEVITIFLDDIQGWDDGLICGGRMTVLIHPIFAEHSDFPAVRDYYRNIMSLTGSGCGLIEAVVCEEDAHLPLCDRYLFDYDHKPIHFLGTSPAWDSVAAIMSDLPSLVRPTTHQGIAFLPTRPRVKLLIVGGGHVGQAVGKLATEVGFDLWVLDDREQFASQSLFPQAQRLIVGNIGHKLRELVPTLSRHTYGLVITRGHNHDEEALYHLAGSVCDYVGMIGSKRKIKLIFEGLESKGIPRETLARVHAPIGLEIGSQTVPEIAISIVAELIAFRNLGISQKRA